MKLKGAPRLLADTQTVSRWTFAVVTRLWESTTEPGAKMGLRTCSIIQRDIEGCYES